MIAESCTRTYCVACLLDTSLPIGKCDDSSFIEKIQGSLVLEVVNCGVVVTCRGQAVLPTIRYLNMETSVISTIFFKEVDLFSEKML